MEPSCVRHNSIPGTSRLFLDYLYNVDRVAVFYGRDGWDVEHVEETAKAIQFPIERRRKLVAALGAQNSDSAALSKLAQPETVAVVTGQQVGFLSGPAYTIFKALTAVKLATHLTEQGIPAVPIFWLATEDHDLAEVDHAWVFDREAMPAKISIANTVVNGGPVGDVVLNEIPLADLRAALGDLPFADDAIKAVKVSMKALSRRHKRKRRKIIYGGSSLIKKNIEILNPAMVHGQLSIVYLFASISITSSYTFWLSCVSVSTFISNWGNRSTNTFILPSV